jgi:stearoyl-CoA desaturase (Delta-9 desaturase)
MGRKSPTAALVLGAARRTWSMMSITELPPSLVEDEFSSRPQPPSDERQPPNPGSPTAAVATAPEPGQPTTAQRAITLAFVIVPFVAFVVAATQIGSLGPSLLDAGIALFLYVVVGFGITVGYHRMLTHRSLQPRRPLKVALAIAGSLAFEGGPVSWVADHRRHHLFSDRRGDPHSPQPVGRDRSVLRGLAHAHVGWLLNHEPTSARHSQDLRDDRDIVWIDRLFPLWCVVSLAIPFALGYVIGGGLRPGLTALLWGGGVRIFLQHHVTWSINSICHTMGRRPFRTKDQSRNVAALALASFGESWHNGHHALPRSARHGLLPHQWDPAARLIRGFERLGWATQVNWPTGAQVARVRVSSAVDDAPPPA